MKRLSPIKLLAIVLGGLCIWFVGVGFGWWGPAMVNLTLYDEGGAVKGVIVGTREIEDGLMAVHNSLEDTAFILHSGDVPKWQDEDGRHHPVQIVKRCLQEGNRMEIEWVGRWAKEERRREIEQKVTDLRAAGLRVTIDPSGNSIVVQQD
jgi:hypothetical protein